jgi:phage terminase small subunit
VKRKLTPKQRLFIKEYLIDLNATQAAIRAGYSKKTARSIGQRLLTYVDIRNELVAAMHTREEKTDITAERVLKELALIAFADMKNYVAISEDGVVTANTWDEMPESASRVVQEVKEVRRIMGSGEGGKEIILECRLGYKHHSKVQALELIGNHLGMWKNIEEIKFPDVETFELPKLVIASGNGGNGGHGD